MTHLLKVICCFFVILISSLWVINPCVAANPYRARQVEEVELLIGDLKVFPVEGLKRVAVGDPDVADVSIISDKEIMLMAKSEGMTTLVIWDKAGKRSFAIKVVAEDIDELVEQIKRLLKANGIEGVTVKVEGQKVFLVGEVVRPRDIVQIKEIIAPFPQVVNLVRVRFRKPLVQINAEVVEVGRDDLKKLGIRWLRSFPIKYDWSATIDIPSLSDLTTKTEGSISLAPLDGMTEGGLLARLDFLISEGKARELSSPSIVTLSGEEASIIVGGEIPISLIGEDEVEVEWKEYGIILKIKPTVIAEDEIRTDIKAEVSAPDWTREVMGVPAFTTKTAETNLILKSGDMIIIGGLITSEETKTLDRVPFLSKIPILGELFKSTEVIEGETELIIAVTPRSIELGQAEEAEFREEKIFKGADVTDEEHALSEGPAEEGDRSVTPPVRCKLSNEVKRLESRLDEPWSSEDLKLASPDTQGYGLIYIRLLQAKISQGMIYPEPAMRAGWEGEVILGLCLSSDGTLEDIVVARSSGIQALDRAAIEAVKEQAPYPPFPPELKKKGLWVNIPVVYKLSAF